MSRAVNIARRALSVEDEDDEDEDDGCLLQHDDATPVYKMTTIRTSATPGSDGSVPEAPASVDVPSRGGVALARARRAASGTSDRAQAGDSARDAVESADLCTRRR